MLRVYFLCRKHNCYLKGEPTLALAGTNSEGAKTYIFSWITMSCPDNDEENDPCFEADWKIGSEF